MFLTYNQKCRCSRQSDCGHVFVFGAEPKIEVCNTLLWTYVLRADNRTVSQYDTECFRLYRMFLCLDRRHNKRLTGLLRFQRSFQLYQCGQRCWKIIRFRQAAGEVVVLYSAMPNGEGSFWGCHSYRKQAVRSCREQEWTECSCSQQQLRRSHQISVLFLLSEVLGESPCQFRWDNS